MVVSTRQSPIPTILASLLTIYGNRKHLCDLMRWGRRRCDLTLGPWNSHLQKVALGIPKFPGNSNKFPGNLLIWKDLAVTSLVYAAIAHEAAPNKLPSAWDSFATKTAIFSSSLQSLERICGRAYLFPPAHIRVRNCPILPKILTCSFTNRID